MPTDEPDKAAEFHLLKRVGSGVADLPYEKYEVAQRRFDRMPVLPLPGARIRKTSERILTWVIPVDALDPQRLYLGTYLDVIAPLDGGNLWTRDVNPFATVPTESLVLERGAGVTYPYAFTLGRGVRGLSRSKSVV